MTMTSPACGFARTRGPPRASRCRWYTCPVLLLMLLLLNRQNLLLNKQNMLCPQRRRRRRRLTISKSEKSLTLKIKTICSSTCTRHVLDTHACFMFLQFSMCFMFLQFSILYRCHILLHDENMLFTQIIVSTDLFFLFLQVLYYPWLPFIGKRVVRGSIKFKLWYNTCTLLWRHRSKGWQPFVWRSRSCGRKCNSIM